MDDGKKGKSLLCLCSNQCFPFVTCVIPVNLLDILNSFQVGVKFSVRNDATPPSLCPLLLPVKPTTALCFVA